MRLLTQVLAPVVGASLLVFAQGCTTCVGSQDEVPATRERQTKRASSPSPERDQMHTLSVAGKQRQYLVQTPRGYKKGGKYPLMVLFPHDRRGPRNFSDRIHITQGAAKLGYLLAVPQAPVAWQHGMCAASATVDGAAVAPGSKAPAAGAKKAAARAENPAAPKGKEQAVASDAAAVPEDIDFGRQMLAAIKNEYSVDPLRIYLVGVGAGAALAERLATEIPNETAALVSVSSPTGCDRQSVPMPAGPVSTLIIDSRVSLTVASAAAEPGASALGHWMRANRCNVKSKASGNEVRMECPSPTRMTHVGVPGLRNEWPVKIGRSYAMRYVDRFFRDSRR